MSTRTVPALLSVLILAVVVVPVLAHMKVAKTLPAADATVASAPALVQVWFTQAPDPAVSKLEMAGPSGPVTLHEFQVMPDKSLKASVAGALADGRYVVRWQSAGDDGHVMKGEFAFSVKQGR